MPSNSVEIVELDADASKPSGEGSLIDLHLKITRPPSGWIRIFDIVWEKHFYMMKRHAHATTKHIVIRAMPDELQKKHIPELKTVVEQSNAHYAKALAEQEAQEQAKSERKKKHEEDMKKLSDDLEI